MNPVTAWAMADELEKIGMGKLVGWGRKMISKGLKHAKENPMGTAMNAAMFGPMLLPAKKPAQQQAQQQAGRAVQQAF